ncbi:hypothetical protein FHW36_105443 [Chitinophaga polysaccharea]|uniref:Uncharacterized protein n=1 Tax=Chitinophaga polysaccharea TaxID=1293035 RepID=A0A561PPG3_9BACT|nr:hypothetical protein FHW36_105443 [Chitinophaga polysaccharea]
MKVTIFINMFKHTNKVFFKPNSSYAEKVYDG